MKVSVKWYKNRFEHTVTFSAESVTMQCVMNMMSNVFSYNWWSVRNTVESPSDGTNQKADDVYEANLDFAIFYSNSFKRIPYKGDTSIIQQIFKQAFQTDYCE